MHRSPETEHRYLARRAVREWEATQPHAEHVTRDSMLRIATSALVLWGVGTVALLAAFAAFH